MWRLTFLFVTLVLVGCTAHFPVNPPLDRYDPSYGYRLENRRMPPNSDELFLMLTFSGGGTRAAALAYGVLEELARTEVIIEGRRRRLLDEVDGISAVSGGSFTAGYYGLFGERIFEDFEDRFLKQNIQKAISSKLLSPVSWFRLGSRNFARSDLAAEYYDKHIFDGGTFGDIMARSGPMVVINATDMTLGAQFEFSQDQFDWICSDLSKVRVARAVAASSAVPVLLTPITLRNYAGRCGYRPPEWFIEALKARDVARRRYQDADRLFTYLDALDKPYIHLVDGGLSDNLGLKPVLDHMLRSGDAWRGLRLAGLENKRRVAFIVVNAEVDLDYGPDKQKRAPKVRQVLYSTSGFAISMNNFEIVQSIRENIPTWREDVAKHRCELRGQMPAAKGTKPVAGACDDIEFEVVEVSIELLPDQQERDYLKGLPTSFHLPAEDVDKLREAAARILTGSTAYQRLLRGLR